jgi:hypothetical protein
VINPAMAIPAPISVTPTSTMSGRDFHLNSIA